jgi:soluble lytic murein transglycosylase-like protein/TolA-binding protein
MFMLVESPFGSSVDLAFNSAQSRDWQAAMTALDKAWTDDPAAFEANNLYYLRARIAAEQGDWGRALEDFTRIDPRNPLRTFALWHGAEAALKLGAGVTAERFIDELPSDFPQDIKLEILRNASPELALRVLTTMTTREARLQRALLVRDTGALWGLVRERNSDDVALQSARKLLPLATTSADLKDLAATFLAHRQFADASAAYKTLSQDPQFAAESQYQLARMRFLSQDYAGAVDGYRAVAAAFPGTDWERDAEYQVANSLWRLRNYPEAEKAYLHYIDQFQTKGSSESVVRDLVDVYRALGQNDKAIALIDRTLPKRPSAATRQVLLFTKAKIFYSQEKYANALQVIRQLKGANLISTPGGTSSEELVYFEGLALAKTGNLTAAKAAWTRLATKPTTYYGQLAAQKLGTAQPAPTAAPCGAGLERTREDAFKRLTNRRRPVLTEDKGRGDALTELIFLQLWDEASLAMDAVKKPDSALAADLAYISGRYNRAITYAGKLPVSTPSAEALLYPAGFQTIICQTASDRGVDPLWLHAIIWQESKYNPAAHSTASARGLMQFIPDTAEAIAGPVGISGMTLDRLYEPEVSIQLGAYYWAELLTEFKSPELALAAYNGGPENVRRWRDKWPGGSDGEFFVSDIGFTETKRYVQAVFGARAAYGRTN